MSTKYIASWRLPNQENSSKNDNYGLTYDGSNEYIDCGDSDIFSFGNSSSDFPFTVSAWVYIEGSSTFPVFDKYPDSGSWSLREYRMLEVNSSNQVFCTLYDSSKTARFDIYSDSTITRNQWQHLSITYDGRGDSDASDGVKIYINGVESTKTVNAFGTYVAMENKSTPVRIGRLGSTYADGTISQLSLFDYALTSTQISTLYGSSSLGSGNPMALKPQPVAYYPLGDNSASNPLTQPNVAVEDASVFDFDASDSDIINTSYSLTSGNKTISFWFNSSYAGYQCILGDATDGFVLGHFTSHLPTPNGISYTDQDTGKKFGITGSLTDEFADGNWHHFMYVYDGNSKIYIDGTERTISYRSGTISSDDIVIIDDLGIGLNLTGYPKYTGKISNVAIWNSDQSSEISNIYNSGVPATTYTNTPTAWYKLNNTANWEADSSGNWQIPDANSAYPQSFYVQSKSVGTAKKYIETNIDNLSDIDVTNKITVSAWVNFDNVAANAYNPIVNKGLLLNSNNLSFALARTRASNGSTTGKVYAQVKNASSTTVTVYSDANAVSSNEWANVVMRYDGVNVKIYVNGKLYETKAQTGNILDITPTEPVVIGSDYYYSTGFGDNLVGKVSNVQIWNTDLTDGGVADGSMATGQIAELYNNGTPLKTAIATDNLKGWYKLDNSATFSTNWSIPDASGNGNTGTSSGMTEQNLVNNNVSTLNGESSGMTSASLVLSDLTRAVPYGDGYSFNFDSASSDYININSVLTQLNSTSVGSWSCWVKPIDATPTSQQRIIQFGDTNGNGFLYIRIETDGKISSQARNNGVSAWSFISNSTIFSDNTWVHIMIIQDGAQPKIYKNGIEVPISFSISTDKTAWFNNLSSLDNGRIGAGNQNNLGDFQFFSGSISNVSFFNKELTSTEVMKLYSNGVPQDLSSFSPQPVAWYPLGSNSFWNGSNWTVRDMIGSNDGTSANIGADGLVGQSPRSSANGVGTNNSIPENLVGTTKWSDNNSWSINMSSEARKQDTP